MVQRILLTVGISSVGNKKAGVGATGGAMMQRLGGDCDEAVLFFWFKIMVLSFSDPQVGTLPRPAVSPDLCDCS
jgi:hypothetical protein